MNRLANLLERSTATDEGRIPSGYTYLLQLVAHDMVDTTVPFWALLGGILESENVRRGRLRLNTLYGEVRGACPFAFAPDDDRDRSRSRFRLGPIGPIAEQNPLTGPSPPFRDIGRAEIKATSGARRPGMTDPLLADSRNDQHSLISQLTVLFQALHNGIAGLLPPPPPDRPAAEVLHAMRARFDCARAATCLLYRHVVRNDLLARVLHPGVRARYLSGTPAFLDPGGAELPLEFSHGAFRFGHAMIRPSYSINAEATAPEPLQRILHQSSTQSPWLMPLTREWIVQWSHFFPVSARTPENASLGLRPAYNAGLVDADFLPPIDGCNKIGLAYRDLMSAGLAGLWSVPALIREVVSPRPDLAALSPLLASTSYREQALHDWFAPAVRDGVLSPEDVPALVAEPPLPFFVLFEAEHDRQRDAGCAGLGVLGSLIVAEVIVGLLRRDPVPGEGRGTLREALAWLSTGLVGRDCLGPVADIADMAGLIRATATLNGWIDADPPFI